MNPKLLQPGWGGALDPEESAFIKRELKTNRRVRAKWGMGRGHGHISENKIRQVAMFGVDGLQEPPSELLAGDSELQQKSEGC